MVKHYFKFTGDWGVRTGSDSDRIMKVLMNNEGIGVDSKTT